jgi:predicted O-methyltransferase YrrM
MRKIKDLYRFLSPRFQNIFLEYKVRMVPRYGHGKGPHEKLYGIINENRSRYLSFLEEFLAYSESFRKIPVQQKSHTEPFYDNGFLPALDMLALYGMIRHFKPRKYVEIGSGNSTKIAALAVKEAAIETKIISIDPVPRAEIDILATEIIRKAFEDTDPALLHDLEPGDILFVDNSHRILPNSDATAFFLDVLPFLKKGVILHIHDVYLPYDYPLFMTSRSYSEQYALAAYILANPKKYACILPNYFISMDKELFSLILPVWDHEGLQRIEKHGGSFWMEIS